MAKHKKSLYALLAAAGFYGFFGLFVPRFLMGDTQTRTDGAANAVQSIAPVMNAVVLTVTLILIAMAIRIFLGERNG